jgi:hypothetical protein
MGPSVVGGIGAGVEGHASLTFEMQIPQLLATLRPSIAQSSNTYRPPALRLDLAASLPTRAVRVG